MEEDQVIETTEATQEVSPPAAPAPTPAPAATPKADGPAPVPYGVFSKTNAELRTTQAALEAANAQLAEYGPDKVQALTSQVEATKQAAAVQLGLVKAGAEDQYLEYLATRYGSMEGDKPPANEWAASLKAAEPAFFGSPSDVSQTPPTDAPASTPTTPPPTTNPDASVSPPANSSSQPKPLSNDAIRSMSQAEFADRWDEIRKWRAGQP